MVRSFIPSIFEEFDSMCNHLTGCRNEREVGSSKFGISVSENEKSFFYDVPLPGVNPEKIDVMLDQEKGKLVIKAEGSNHRENVKYHMHSDSSFYYEIPLSNSIDLNASMDAICKEGMLKLTLPKCKSSQPMKIDVRIA